MDRFWLYFFTFLIVLVVLLGIFRPDQLDNALAMLGLFLTILLWTVAGCALAALAVLGGIAIYKIRHRSRRQQDGAWPLQHIRLGRGRVAVVDPNAMVSFGYMVDKKTGQIAELQPAAGWHIQATVRALVEKTRQAQAIYPGDDTRKNRFGALAKGPTITAGAMRALAAADKPPKIIGGEPEDWSDTPPPSINLLPGPVDVLGTSDKDHWTVGQADDGSLCQFQPALHSHAAIVGNTGTGKTTSVAALIAAQAVRNRWHVLILDPDGGADWSPFASVAEHHETDRATFADQIAAVHRIYEQRQDGANKRPILVVMEEYGDIINQLRMVSRKDADHVDAMLDSMLRRGRKRRVHLMFVDQYPEHWSPQVISGTKFRAVFQLGPNQGAKLQEYKAHELPDRGAFLNRGTVYHTWHAAADMPTILRPAETIGNRRIIDGTATLGTATPAPLEPEEAAAKWRDHTDAWFGAHPEYITEPYGGISHLARSMAAADGRPDDWPAYKSTAKSYFDAFLREFATYVKHSTKE